MPRDRSQTVQDHESASAAPEAQFQKLIETISRSQQGFRDLIDHLDQAVFTITLDGEIRVANTRFAEILGVPFSDLIGHNLAEFVAVPLPEEIAGEMPSFLRTGSWSGRVPVRLRRTNETLYFDCYVHAAGENGRTVIVSGWARDVTAVRDTQLRSMELFESLHEGILFSTPDGRILDANPALVRMLGYASKEDLQGRNLSDLYADPSHRSSLITKIEKTGSVQDVEIVLVRKGGRQICCLGSARGIRDAAGALVRIQATLRDVTEQRLMEHELHKEREFGRRLIACFPDVIALLDTDSRFTYVSESVRYVLGQPASFFIGERLGSNSGPEDREKLDAMMQSLLSGGSVRGQVEVQAPHADGSRRSFRISAAPLLDENGKITGIVTSGRDVTESNLQDRQLAEREKFTAMGQMLAGAAHELNNPLTAILGVSDLLTEGGHDELTRRQAGLILKQARRAADIVQNLLAFSRPRSSGLIPLRVEDVIQHILLSQRAEFEKKGIVVNVDTSPDLAPVEADRKLLTQVFSNIIVNAEQAISAAKLSGTIAISIRPAGDRVCISFQNDGPPIPADIAGKLFDPFFTTKRPGGGSGLGLTICLAIVKDHGGSIDVESQQTGGATFRIYLPAAKVSSAKAQQSITSPSPTEGSDLQSAHNGSQTRARAPAKSTSVASKIIPALQGHSIVVVDDEESILEIMEDGLSARGLKVVGFSTAQDALDHLEKNSCEVVLCDFNMPGMKGSELFERVRAQKAAAPRFIFMTGELVESEAIAALREQGALTLQKPFHIPAVADVLLSIFRPQS
ncbi:MAG: PAS domain-containing hybrid sensor histidine kinase/response regulator [Candidatus Acidiferrales bacterium]